MISIESCKRVVTARNDAYQHSRSRKAHYPFRVHSEANPKYVQSAIVSLLLFRFAFRAEAFRATSPGEPHAAPFGIFFRAENRKRAVEWRRSKPKSR